MTFPATMTLHEKEEEKLAKEKPLPLQLLSDKIVYFLIHKIKIEPAFPICILLPGGLQ